MTWILLTLTSMAQAADTSRTTPSDGATFWLPEQASTVAGEVDFVFYFIYWLCVFFFIVMMGATALFAWKYRAQSDTQRTDPISHNNSLEIAWSVFPGLLLVVMFVLGFQGYINMSVPPADSEDINVTGQKWDWSYDYPGTPIEGEKTLVVPANQPVRLVMTSTDVLHSFFVPAFRIKKDVLPNRYTVLWFEATKVGEYQVYCTEYCGNGHSRMLSKVSVLEPSAYRAWKAAKIAENANLSDLPPERRGELLFTKKACSGCHSVDGSNLVGPTLKGKWGVDEKLADGSTVNFDENYFRQSLMEPASQVVAGFAPSMPSYAGQLEDQEIGDLMAYLKTLAN